MKVVSEIKEQFTLADVLPSSLECSDREGCSYHNANSRGNSNANSRNFSANQDNNNRLPPIERTIDEGLIHEVELINEAEEQIVRRGSFIEKIEAKAELVNVEEDKEMQTDQDNDDSQRGLRPTQMRPASIDLNNESQKQLLTKMLSRSVFNDMDNSRNDVVPQRTLIEEPFASIHPEGVEDCSKSSLSSSEHGHDREIEDNASIPVGIKGKVSAKKHGPSS